MQKNSKLNAWFAANKKSLKKHEDKPKKFFNNYNMPAHYIPYLQFPKYFRYIPKFKIWKRRTKPP